eukprot:c27111_g1_i1.p1 GENE.c27111_g1_i1~~c27111_g1_i1.p1  ORF type:complete len:148 (+),score=17.34 c27111_g1_i1:65-445(+)
MSWQQYVDSNLKGSGFVREAAIVGFNGAVWAKSAGMNPTAAEVTTIVSGFATPGNLAQNGIRVNGKKFMFISADDKVVKGKDKATGIHIVKTKQALIISYYDDKIQPGACANATEKIADYLREQGY